MCLIISVFDMVLQKQEHEAFQTTNLHECMFQANCVSENIFLKCQAQRDGERRLHSNDSLQLHNILVLSLKGQPSFDIVAQSNIQENVTDNATNVG